MMRKRRKIKAGFGALASGVLLGTVAVAALPAATALAETVTIDFEADTAGTKANGFASVDDDRVLFTDSIGSDLMVDDFGSQGDGLSLLASSDDPSALIMDFTEVVTSVQLEFGNDDPCCIPEGGLASLRLFDGATEVADVTVAVNRNDLMDQQISATLASGTADRAEFQYQNADRTPANLVEIVDNITVEFVEEVCDNGIDDDADGAVDGDDLDCPLPVVTVGDASVTEGDSGTADLVFPVELSGPLGSDLEVAWEVTGGTAGADDLGAMSGTVTIVAGATTGQITVPVVGDTTVEPDETAVLTVTLTSAGDRTPEPVASDPTGTIANDDAPPTTAPPSTPTTAPPATAPRAVVATPTYTG